ncbi:hypothetical protein BDF20DRAFT_819058 [Mycotypha africana]|uniref:uncharacterized protein n=1 Tax=Mycotypha africana TaxID=64632 RepID=UPI0023001169|nr:uncharacterized protein BDF20DRAFT_819058 [Mycotypha africana]KAI8979636.1 hypothetical protein BDF20DRAFT_819058 [Mycotypha africana]
MTATAGIEDEEDPDDEELNSNNANSPSKRSGRRKIKIEFIEDKTRRHITFSKRKAGIMKKAYELSTLTGTQVLLLVVSETGLVYTFTTPKLQPLVTKPEGKNLIQSCLNSFEEEDQQQHQQQQQITNNDSNDDENSYLPSTVVGSTTSPSMVSFFLFFLF